VRSAISCFTVQDIEHILKKNDYNQLDTQDRCASI